MGRVAASVADRPVRGFVAGAAADPPLESVRELPDPAAVPAGQGWQLGAELTQPLVERGKQEAVA